jgi:hypothetical protein
LIRLRSGKSCSLHKLLRKNSDALATLMNAGTFNGAVILEIRRFIHSGRTGSTPVPGTSIHAPYGTLPLKIEVFPGFRPYAVAAQNYQKHSQIVKVTGSERSCATKSGGTVNILFSM